MNRFLDYEEERRRQRQVDGLSPSQSAANDIKESETSNSFLLYEKRRRGEITDEQKSDSISKPAKLKQEERVTTKPKAKEVLTKKPEDKKDRFSINQVKDSLISGIKGARASITDTASILASKMVGFRTPALDLQKDLGLLKEKQTKELKETDKAFSNTAKKLKVDAQKQWEDQKRFKALNIPVKNYKNWKESTSDPQWIANTIAESTPNLMATMGLGTAVGLLTKNPALGMRIGMGTGGSIAAGYAYKDAKDSGVDDKKAENIAIIVGVANSMLEALPIGTFFSKSPAGREVKSRLIERIAGRVIAQSISEGSTESLQEIVSNAVALSYDENRDLFRGVPESAFIGAVMGGGFGVFADASSEFVNSSPEDINKIIDNKYEIAKNKAPQERTVEESELVRSYDEVIGDTLKPSLLEQSKAPSDESSIPDVVREELEKPKQKYDYQSTQLNIPKAASDKMLTIAEKVDINDLSIDEADNRTGFEGEPHVTVLYGLSESVKEQDVRNLLKDVPPIEVSFGSTSKFDNAKEKGYEVLKIDVESEQLRAVNKMLQDNFDVPGQTFKDYKPHATIAYLQPGTADKYVGDTTMVGEKIVLNELVLSKTDGTQITIPLEGKSNIEEVENNSDLSLEDQLKVMISEGSIEEAQNIHANSKSNVSFDALVKEVEDVQYAYLDEVKREMDSIENIGADDPTGVLKQMAVDIANHLKNPLRKRLITGNRRIYTTTGNAGKNISIEVGGTFTEAIDRLFFEQDIEGFSKAMNVMSDKFNKFYTQIYDKVRKGDIDDSDYEQFKKRLKQEIENTGTGKSSKSSLKSKSKDKTSSNKTDGSSSQSKTSNVAPSNKSSLGSVDTPISTRTGDNAEPMAEARKYKTTINVQDKNDLTYLRRILSEDQIKDIQNGKMVNWRGIPYEDLARVNLISKTPQTIEQRLAGKIKDIHLKSDTLYHGTSADSAKQIMRGGFKSGNELPKNAYRGGGYGHIQYGVSFAETPKEAGIFATLTRDGEIIEARLNKGARIVTIESVEDAVELSDYTKYLIKQGVDAVYIGGGEKEVVVLNTKAVTPVKSQPPDIWKKANAEKTGGSLADKDSIRPDFTGGKVGYVRALEMPEIVAIAKELTGKTPEVKEKLRALGYFTPDPKNPRIRLKASIFEDPNSAAATLAHEIGHLIDFLPDMNIKRGNLIGRLNSLSKHMKSTFGESEITNKDVKQELLELTNYWKPYDRLNDPKSYVKYRESAPELYADAISVLFNDPYVLKKKAPKFWREFFDKLDKKQEVKDALFETYELLNMGEEKLFEKRQKEVMDMYRTSEEKFVALEIDKQKKKSNFIYTLRVLFDNKNQAIVDKVKQVKKDGKALLSKDNPVYALEGLNYLDGKIENFVEKNYQPIYEQLSSVPNGWEQLGAILLYERAINERGDKANPLGYNPTTAQFQLDQMQKSMPKSEWESLQKALKHFREATNSIVDSAQKNGFYSEDMIKEMKANPSYATFQVIEYLDTNISAQVYKAVGTLKEIANPATSTVMKSISVLKAIERNNAKKKVVSGVLQKFFPTEIEPAKTSHTGKNKVFLESKNKEQGMIKVIEDGRLNAYYVDKEIAISLDYLSEDTINKAAKISRLITGSKIYRPLFTSLNLGFQSFNAVRDFMRYWRNVPDYTLQDAILSFPRAAVRYVQAIPAARNKALGNPDVIIQQMKDIGALGGTYNNTFGYGDVDPEQQQIERILQRTGILKKTGKRGIFKPIYDLLDGIETLGSFIEALPKVAGYIELKGKMPQEELANFIRTRVGSPDFRTTGRATPVTNNIFLFSNAIKEGIKTDIQAAKDPRTRSGFWWKMVVGTFLPKVIMMGALTGLFGEWYEERMRDVSEYDKSNYTIVPTGVDEDGKTTYLRVPQDETGRFMGGLFWKIMRNANREDLKLEDIFDVFDYGAGQMPSLSPAFVGSGAILMYLSGKNPYDPFRNRYVIPDTTFKAGFKYSLPVFVDWFVKNQGAGIVLPSYVPDNPTELQKRLALPVISNTIGRWIRSTDYGRTEEDRRIRSAEEQQAAIKTIEKKEKIKDAVSEYNEGSNSISRRLQIEKKLVIDVLGKPPYDSTQKSNRTRLLNTFRIALVRGEADQRTTSIIDAPSNDIKIELLRKAKKEMKGEDYKQYLKDLRKQNVISEKVYVKSMKLQ